MFKNIGFIVLSFVVLWVGYSGGVNDGRRQMEDACTLVKQTYEQASEVDSINADLFLHYINGDISEEQASSMFMDADEKTATIPMNIKSWGNVEISEYDPSQDPHSGKTSPFGTGSCVVDQGNDNFGCGDDKGSHFKCTISVKVSAGPLKGITFYSKDCDGRPVAERKGSKVIIHYKVKVHRKL